MTDEIAFIENHSGRVVIPKAIREQLNLKGARTLVKVTIENGAFVLQPVEMVPAQFPGDKK